MQIVPRPYANCIGTCMQTVYKLIKVYTKYVHNTYTNCIHIVYKLRTHCVQAVYEMYTMFASTHAIYKQHANFQQTMCTLRTYGIHHAHKLYTSCLQIVHKLDPNCIQLVYKLHANNCDKVFERAFERAFEKVFEKAFGRAFGMQYELCIV